MNNSFQKHGTDAGGVGSAASMEERSLAIVGRYSGVWDSPPTEILTGAFSDAPLMGNGDLGVILAGTADEMEFFLGKNEFISQNEGIPKALSRIQLHLPRSGKVLPIIWSSNF